MIDHLSETALSDGLVYGVITEQEYIVYGPNRLEERGAMYQNRGG